MATANTDLYLRSQASKDTSPVATDLYLRSADEKAGILLVGTNTITVSAPTATRSPGYVVWMESGSDATSDTSFFSSVGGAVTSATDQYHTGSRSIKCSTGSPAALATAFRTDVLADTGRRVSFWMRYDTTPIASAAVMLADTSGGATVFNVRVTPTNLMAVISGSGVANGSIPLEPNQWNRITVSYVITSATEFRIDVYVNGVLDISAKNSGTLTNIGTSRLGFRAGTNFGANANLWFDDIYVDDGGDFTDPGDIRVTAKRPNANGANNTFDTTTSTTNSGYGTGNAIYVNERPLATTGARSQAGTGAAYENFAIENAATGDVDITGKTIKGRLSWVHGSGVSTDTIYNNGTAVVPDSVFTTTAGNRYVVTTSNAYPSSSSAVGMGRPTGNATDAVLNEAGMLIAFVGVSSITLSADTNTVTTSAPTAIRLSGAIGRAGGVQTVTLSNPAITRAAISKAAVNPNSITESNPGITIYQLGGKQTFTLDPQSITATVAPIKLLYVFACSGQFTTANSTTSAGNWTPSEGSNLENMINEGMLADTSTYIQSGNTPYEDTVKFNLTGINIPATSNVVIAIWTRKVA